MIAQIFNSSLISGPETLVLPNLQHIQQKSCVVWLREDRQSDEKNRIARQYFTSFGEVHEIPVQSRRDPEAVRRLHETLLRIQARVAHAHDVKASYLLHLTGKNTPYKKISTHHGVHARSGFRQIVYEQFYSRLILPQMDRTLLVCSSDLEIMARRGISRDRLRLHLNGVDRPLVPLADRARQQKVIRDSWDFHPPAGEKLFGIIARLDHEKDHHKALRVFKMCSDLPFRVICFGTGPLQKDLEKETRRLGLQERVRWAGYRTNLGSEVAGLDGLLSFSRAEGLPINLLEAGWAGTPVFARCVDGVADLIPSQEFGYAFAPQRNDRDTAELFREFVGSDQTEKGRNLQMRVSSAFSGHQWAQRFEAILAELDANS